jgi:protein-tyrosine phosphatase
LPRRLRQNHSGNAAIWIYIGSMSILFSDIHCHLLPGIDDGARDWDESLAMARLAVADGMATMIATPHQLGSFAQNRAAEIRTLTTELQQRLLAANIPLRVLPGGEIRIEPGLIDRLDADEVLSLGDHHRHLLLELPHHEYLPMERLLRDLKQRQLTVILAHPERNGGFLNDPELIEPLVEAGCLMQITAGSLCGILGPEPQQMSEWMIERGLVHFVATDSHGVRTRRPLMGRAFERLCELADERSAHDLCSRFPARVAAGRSVAAGCRTVLRQRWNGWWARRAAA